MEFSTALASGGTVVDAEALLARVNHRRRLVHLHSVLYYHMHTPIVGDLIFDVWCQEIVNLHRVYPWIIPMGYEPEVFKDWTGDTGMHLPVTDHMWDLALRMRAYARSVSHQLQAL